MKENITNISLETSLGVIDIELYPDKAPITVSNFLKYIDKKRYNDFHFYRVVHLNNQPNSNVKIEVIQGGLGSNRHPMELPSVRHETTEETGLNHLDGTISMARLEPGTANSEIFICINDQPELDFGGKRNPDGQGFSVFGKVTNGMDIVRIIQKLPENGQILDKIIPVLAIKKKRK